MLERPPPSAKNPVPGTYATRAPIAAGSIAFASTPSGSVTQTKKPPAGRVQLTPAGMAASNVDSIASRRVRYSSRNSLSCSLHGWVAR
jgi:hypothetical protein